MFEGIAFVAIWLVLPFIWHYLLKVADLSLFQLTIPAFVILSFYGYQYIGLPILYFQLDEYRASAVSNQWLVAQIFIYTAVTMALMIIGFVAGRRCFGPLKCFGAYEIQKSNKLQITLVLALYGICLVSLALYLTKVGFENIALFTIFELGDNSQAAVARSAMTNAFEGKYHWYYLFMNKGLLFCTYLFFVQFLLNPKLTNRLLVIIVIGIAIFSMTMATEKGPMINLLIALFLVYISVKRKGKFPIKGSLCLGVTIMAVLIIFYINFMNAQDPVQAIFNALSRAFTGQIQPAYHYLEFFPDQHDFLHGRSFPNPGEILPFENYALAKEIMAWYNPIQFQLGIIGSMPTIYWGEMYANFGFWGILLPPFFVGFVLYWINSAIFRFRPTPLVIALFVWFTMHLKNLNGTSLSGYLIDIYGFAILFFFFVIAFISGGGVIKLRRKFSVKRTCFNDHDIQCFIR